ncbi:hypothetical protein T07_7630 [Trichinella nelsoni]|uniref:Uncharacterized protein n=1 Tax=Trichinella nelsoni TaxID=6336 RepID=A0A0V0RYW5_9BILA|nr:hypothetical protein T07_7630 [Trichinella nelsoni]
MRPKGNLVGPKGRKPYQVSVQKSKAPRTFDFSSFSESSGQSSAVVCLLQSFHKIGFPLSLAVTVFKKMYNSFHETAYGFCSSVTFHTVSIHSLPVGKAVVRSFHAVKYEVIKQSRLTHTRYKFEATFISHAG